VLGLRIISNNEVTGPRDDKEKYANAQIELQKFVRKLLEKLCGEEDEP